MKKISVIGSTGSIGTQTLEIVRERGDLQVVAMSCGRNVELFEKQIREFQPKVVAVWEEADAKILKENLSGLAIKVFAGMEGLLQVATAEEAEIVVTAIVGMLGIQPTIAAIKAKKDIALANKETLVCAGHLIMPLAKEMGVRILPVDSEHSAIFQSLQGNEGNKIDKILLTCSGGPFRGKKKEQLALMTKENALKHPNWSMGAKITIDSATLVNKGLEVMEAKWLFGVEQDAIQVIVHPQSYIHSMVQYEDGAIIAQLGTPDMKIPIQYALYYPERHPLKGDRLDFWKLGQMTFEEPDEETFYGLKLAKQALRRGGNAPTILNAANEKAVALFLRDEIGFLQIPETIQRCMEEIPFRPNPSVEEILATEQEVYDFIAAHIQK